MFTGSCICHDVLRILLCGQKSLNATSICLTHGTDFAETLVTVIRESVSRAAGSLLQQEDRFACGMRERARASEREDEPSRRLHARQSERENEQQTSASHPRPAVPLGFSRQVVGSATQYPLRSLRPFGIPIGTVNQRSLLGKLIFHPVFGYTSSIKTKGVWVHLLLHPLFFLIYSLDQFSVHT